MKIDLNDKVVRFLVQEYVNQICNYSSEKDLYWNLHKLIHTFLVREMAQKLIDNTKPPLAAKMQKHILDAAVLHDLGRCHEFKNGEHLKVDHGKVGAELIKEKFPKMKIETQSTLFHNKLPSDKDPKFCQPVLDYVRDADMLANLEYQADHHDMFLLHIFKSTKEFLLTPIIDKEVFKAIKQHAPADVTKIKVKNILTLWLWQLCWIHNLRTDAGIRYAKKEKIFIRFKQTILKKVIPLTTKNKNKQKELIQKIQEHFPDNLLN